MKKRVGNFSFMIFMLLNLISCNSQERNNFKKPDRVSFSKKYNTRINDEDLLLGCIVYAKEVTGPLSSDSINDFYRITAILQHDSRSSPNIDSLINDFLEKNKNIVFDSEKAMFRIKSYVDCYRTVNDIIFGKIDSDDKSDEMKILEDKIAKVPGIQKIYRSYVPPGNDLSSLPSSGIALNIQMAYYLSTLDIYKRNEILKSLL